MIYIYNIIIIIIMIIMIIIIIIARRQVQARCEMQQLLSVFLQVANCQMLERGSCRSGYVQMQLKWKTCKKTSNGEVAVHHSPLMTPIGGNHSPLKLPLCVLHSAALTHWSSLILSSFWALKICVENSDGLSKQNFFSW